MATTKRKPLEEGRRTPKINLIMPEEVQEVLLGLATEDAAETGADPARQRGRTVSALILAERRRRDERAARKKS